MGQGKIRVGIGGWTFEPWRGVFYPDGLRQKDELTYATSKMTAIEINATYYRSQSPKSFVAWAAAAPDAFQYAVKASRFATNRTKLAEAAGSIEKVLAQGLTELGDKLGPILWQFPAKKKFDSNDMADFLALLPESQDGVSLRHALEVRHESFGDPVFIDMARKKGIAIVRADHPEFPLIEADTADFVYARIMRAEDEKAEGYSTDVLDQWAAKARGLASEGRDVYLFFISGAKVRNPAAAQSVIRRLAQ
jgi:uncharacterized protein YecE (DUF72 family)